MRFVLMLAPAFIGFGLVQAFVGPFHLTGFIVASVGVIMWAFDR